MAAAKHATIANGGCRTTFPKAWCAIGLGCCSLLAMLIILSIRRVLMAAFEANLGAFCETGRELRHIEADFSALENEPAWRASCRSWLVAFSSD
jgi:hypothetical protein